MGIGSARKLLGAHAAAGGSSWSPLDLTSLYAWFDFSDTGTITHVAGAVSQVDDLSGNARHITQGTSGNKPVTGTRTVNGLNVLDFGAVDSDWLQYDISPDPGDATHSMVVICASDNVDDNSRIATSGRMNLRVSGGFFVVDISAGLSSTVAEDTGVHLIFAHVLSGQSSGTIQVDGTSATGNVGNGNTFRTLTVGTNDSGGSQHESWNGVICEAIWTTAILSAQEKLDLRAYAQSKWGTP